MVDSTSLITRFAPSPTGALHLGHLASALAVTKLAKALGAKTLLRLEDNDFTRSKPEYTRDILYILGVFGLYYSAQPLFQNDKFHVYREKLDELSSYNLVYPCYRKRCDLPQIIRGLRHTKADLDAAKTQGLTPAWRLDISACLVFLGTRPKWQEIVWSQSFQRLNLIQKTDELTHQNDPVIWRRDGVPAYLLCSTWDDASQNITHIVRGEDTRDFTPIQVLLHCFWGTHCPIFQFHPLIRDKAGDKLSKSKQAKSLADYLEDGLSLDEIITLARFQND